MGNGRVETACLPPGYIPVGTTAFGGIIYMTTPEIVQFILYIIIIVIFGVEIILNTIVNKTEISIKDQLPALISKMVELDIPGPEKMKKVIAIIIADLPKLMKSIFSESRIKQMAQLIYDEMKNFAKEEMKKANEDASKDKTN